jgi:glycerophosphoryl diester phosphodiesterase
MIDELIEYGVPPENVWQQSALEEDIHYWTENTDYDQQAVALDIRDNRARDEDMDWLVGIQMGGAKYVAPPMWKLVEANPNAGAAGELAMIPSDMAIAAKGLGLETVTWRLTVPAGPLEKERGPAYYWQTLQGQGIDGLAEGSNFELLHVLNEQVGIRSIFDDWPAVATFYANCMKKLLRENQSSNSINCTACRKPVTLLHLCGSLIAKGRFDL